MKGVPYVNKGILKEYLFREELDLGTEPSRIKLLLSTPRVFYLY